MINSDLIVERIKFICKEQNIQMSKLEEVVGLSRGNISRWKTSLPKNLEAIIKISQYLNCSSDYILCLDTYESKESRGVNSIIASLILKTGNNNMKWEKMPYERAKKIPRIENARHLYQNFCEAYETSFNNHIIILYYTELLQNTKPQYYLWLFQDGEYVDISFTQKEIEQLFNLIKSKKNQALINLFNELNK